MRFNIELLILIGAGFIKSIFYTKTYILEILIYAFIFGFNVDKHYHLTMYGNMNNLTINERTNQCFNLT